MKRIENDINGNPRLQFNATLLSISNTTLTNRNGKNYKVVSVEFINNDTINKCSGFIFEGNYSHGVTVGEEYLAQATLMPDGGVIVNMSHLPANAERPSADMFAFDATDVAQAASAAKQTAFNAK